MMVNFGFDYFYDIDCKMIFPNLISEYRIHIINHFMISEQTQTHIQEKTPPKGRGISQLYSHEN